MSKEVEDVTRMTMLHAETNRRLSELWSMTAPNFYDPAEDEIACYLLNSSPKTGPRVEATPRAFADFSVMDK